MPQVNIYRGWWVAREALLINISSVTGNFKIATNEDDIRAVTLEIIHQSSPCLQSGVKMSEAVAPQPALQQVGRPLSLIPVGFVFLSKLRRRPSPLGA
jgi:hypothetical protein